MASNDVEVLDPVASVEKFKESGVGLDRRSFLTALGAAGAMASVIAGADLLSSGPTARAQFQPPIGGYQQLDVMNFLMNIKYLKATLYAFLTTGADIPNYPTYVTFGSGQIYNQPAKITTFPTQQITDMFNEMYYDELNQIVSLRNLIGNTTGDVLVVSRPTMDLLGTKSTSSATTTMTFQQAIGYARMLEDLSVQTFAGAAAYLTGTNLAFVSQILATNGNHAGALRLICIQNNIPYLGTNFVTTSAAAAQIIDTYPVQLVANASTFYMMSPTATNPPNPPLVGSPISGINVPQGALITAYTPFGPPSTSTANSTFTAVANNATNPTVLTNVSSIAGLAQYQPVTGTNIPTGAYIVGASGNTVTLSASTSGTSTVAPTGYTTNASATITGVSSTSGILAGQPISGTNIPANATVVSTGSNASLGSYIVISAAATATSLATFSGILTSGSTSITSPSTLSGLTVGQQITSGSSGVPSGTTITALGNAIVMSSAATATTTQTATNFTGTVTNGSSTITNVSNFTGLAVGQPISIPITGTVTNGSTSITSVSNTLGIGVGAPIVGANIPVGTTIAAISGNTVVMSAAATGTATEPLTSGINAGVTITAVTSSAKTITLSSAVSAGTLTPLGTLTPGSNVVTAVSSTAGVQVGQPVSGSGLTVSQIAIPSGTLVGAVTATTITLSPPPVTLGITGNVTSGNNSVTSLSSTSGMAVGQTLYGNFIPAGTTITAISGSTVAMSNAATGTATGETVLPVAAVTATVTSGGTSLTSVTNTSALAVGQTISGNNIVPGAIVTGISGTTVAMSMPAFYTITGSVIGGSTVVSALSSTTGLAVGQLIVGTNIPAGTTITAVTGGSAATLTLSNAVSGTNTSPTPEPLSIYSSAIAAPATIFGAVSGGSNTVTSLSTPTGVTGSGVPAAGLAIGQGITGTNIPSGTTITAVNGNTGTLTLSNAATGSPGAVLETLTITAVTISQTGVAVSNIAAAYFGAFSGVTGGGTTLPGITAAGDNVVSSIPPLTGLAIGQTIEGNYIPAGTTVTAIGAGTATASNPGVGTVTISNAAVGSSFTQENIVITVPTNALLTIGLTSSLVPLVTTTTQSFTSPTTVTLKIPTTVTVTVGRAILSISAPAAATGLQTLTMSAGDIMDVQPFDLGSASAAAAGPTAVTIPSSIYSTSGPTTPTVYQGFFNTAGTGTATASTPPGFAFARSFGQALSVLLGSTQTNPPTYQGGFFPVGVNGPINVNTNQ